MRDSFLDELNYERIETHAVEVSKKKVVDIT